MKSHPSTLSLPEAEILALEFQEASQDAERNSEIALWDILIEDGLDATNAY